MSISIHMSNVSAELLLKEFVYQIMKGIHQQFKGDPKGKEGIEEIHDKYVLYTNLIIQIKKELGIEEGDQHE